MQSVIQISEARRELGELVNQAYYEGKTFNLAKGDKPMVTLIGNREFAEILKVLEKYDPGFADTLAIMSNPEVQAILAEDEESIKAGRLIPFEEWSNDA